MPVISECGLCGKQEYRISDGNDPKGWGVLYVAYQDANQRVCPECFASYEDMREQVSKAMWDSWYQKRKLK